MRKRTPAKRTYKPDSEAAQLDELMGIQRALREYERDGHVSDPVLAARIRDGWRPSVEMAIWAIQPDCPDGIRAICLKTLVEREPSKVELMRPADGGDRAPVIQIQIANWAAGPGMRKAIEMRPVIQAEAVDAEQIAHSDMNTARTPAPRDRLAAAAKASAVTQVLEVPIAPDQPRRVVAEVSQVRGLDMAEQLNRKFGGVSFAQAAKPDANVKSDFDPFK